MRNGNTTTSSLLSLHRLALGLHGLPICHRSRRRVCIRLLTTLCLTLGFIHSRATEHALWPATWQQLPG